MNSECRSATPLADLDVTIVDCQTTGASPAHGSVLELGFCRTRASDPALDSNARAHWVAPPPGMRISTQVRQLTGFDESVLSTALAPEAAWRQLCDQLPPARPTPAAIHYARFELAFLRDWSARFEPEREFPLDVVCVHAIACRLYPDLPRRNLRALAGFLGHGLHLERRCLGHVQATAFVWRKLVEQLLASGIDSWQELAAWLATPSKPSSPRRRSYPLPKARYRALPDGPGVYRLLRSNGDVLYVGKATSLKRRVTSHFTKHSGATERALEMLTQVSDVSFETTPSALEAALLETRTIKRLNPPYNVQLLEAGRAVWFATPDFSKLHDRPDADHRVGPFPSRYALRALRALARILSGEPASDELRSACVGAPLRFAPEQAAFDAGFASFLDAYAAALDAPTTPLRRAVGVARMVLARGRTQEDAADSDPSEEVEAKEGWDGPRVCRHLERALAQSFQLLRRASWLCLLSHSSVAYREPGAGGARLLVLRDADLAEEAELSDGQELPIPLRPARPVVQARFDAARYDALRILTTELKRIQRDGGSVVVRLSRSRQLSGLALAELMRLV